MITKYCEYCGRKYETVKKTQKFCGVPCSHADRERGRCRQCGKAVKSEELRPVADGFLCADHEDTEMLYQKWLEKHRFKCHGTIYTNF